MKTISITYTYDVKGFINDDHILTTCGKVFNIKLGREIKAQMRGSKTAYWIGGKWQSEFNLDINRVECPF